jgi:hypothetical protein
MWFEPLSSPRLPLLKGSLSCRAKLTPCIRTTQEEENLTVEEAIAGLTDTDKGRRLVMFQLLHEAVSGDTRKAISVGRTDAAWKAIHQASIFRPSWDGDQPGMLTPFPCPHPLHFCARSGVLTSWVCVNRR